MKNLTQTQKPLENKQFLVLQAIAIILVVVGHRGDITFLRLIERFPIYSYHMALFVFISGYFFKPESMESIPRFVWHKTKKLLLPYLGWNLAYGIIFVLLTKYQIINYAQDEHMRGINFTTFFVEAWRRGPQYYFNMATWFVFTLYFSQILYVLIRRVYDALRIQKEWVLQLFLSVVGVAALAVIKGFGGGIQPDILACFRIFFFLPFLQFGYFYKTHLEKRDTLGNGWYFLLLFLIQYHLYTTYNEGQLIHTVVWVEFRGNIFLPFITSLVGIMFWLRVSKNIYSFIGSNALVERIGKGSWSIMVHHIFVFFLINYLLSFFFPSFDHGKFREDVWYVILPQWAYCLAGVFAPLLWQKYFDDFKRCVMSFGRRGSPLGGN